ncbi:NAD(P)H-dependent oxidoreductase [Pedobacter glucosidilyticus]|uniref:glutathione-regulated potassium-efflux system oxidoreductase KefF n=1 Tax=Pedobacter glucosidilyticus TaxID=1122941 RepID=UPI00047A35F4|nr:NAD(P)H-dependent oxidoreductase [Pedobacter glucosidilyticus]
MASVLIVFAHPVYEKSRVNRFLVKAVKGLKQVTFHDLYELYPDFDIDVKKEQKILAKHDIIVLQHPFYWYSMPPLLKQWLDLVLEYGWAYGKEGIQLRNKKLFNAITTGGTFEAYKKEGHNRYTITELLYPLDQTAFLCKMTYYPPFVVHGTHRLSEVQIQQFAHDYQQVIIGLRDGLFQEDNLVSATYMNYVIDKPYQL